MDVWGGGNICSTGYEVLGCPQETGVQITESPSPGNAIKHEQYLSLVFTEMQPNRTAGSGVSPPSGWSFFLDIRGPASVLWLCTGWGDASGLPFFTETLIAAIRSKSAMQGPKQESRLHRQSGAERKQKGVLCERMAGSAEQPSPPQGPR